MTAIGFIGLGNMGGPMARNLLKAGHAVRAFDLSAAALDAAVQAGATKASGLADAVAHAEIVVTMLPAGPHVRQAYLAEDGILAKVGKGALLIDCSTIDVGTAREVSAAAKRPASPWSMPPSPAAWAVPKPRR